MFRLGKRLLGGNLSVGPHHRAPDLEGGPFHNPRNWQMRTNLTIAGIWIFYYFVFKHSLSKERVSQPPTRPYPSQYLMRYSHLDDPDFVKKQAIVDAEAAAKKK